MDWHCRLYFWDEKLPRKILQQQVLNTEKKKKKEMVCRVYMQWPDMEKRQRSLYYCLLELNVL